MSLDSFLSLILGIPIGVISGLYTGVIVSRYVRFSELRTEVLRAIRSIDFIQEESAVRVTDSGALPRFHLVASDLVSLGHRVAGERVLRLAQEMAQANQRAGAGKLPVEEYERLFGCWQEKARLLAPRKRVLWSLWGKL